MPQGPAQRVNFAAVRAACAPHLLQILQEIFPHGKRAGHEWTIGSANGEPGKSLSVNVRTGVGADFATGEKYADIIDVFAAARCSGDKMAAARELSARYLGEGAVNGHEGPNGHQHDTAAVPDRGKFSSATPPDDAPALVPPENSIVYPYRNAAGKIMSYVVRVERRGGGKTFRGVSWGSIDGDKSRWRWHHPAPPHTLFGLELLAERPEAPVLVVEGEKAALAAREKFPNHVCVTWRSGAGAVRKTDWSPLAGRNVVIWPDNDTPGHQAAQAIADILPQAVILRVADLPPSADAADIEAPSDPAAWLRERLPPDDLGAEHDSVAERPPDRPLSAEAMTGRESVLPLGYDHGSFFYYSTATRQITMLRGPEHSRANLTALASATYWYRAYPHHRDKSGVLSWPSVADSLMEAARQAGIYDPDRLRGRGVWYSEAEDRVVFHAGDRLVIDGAEHSISPGAHVYEAALPLIRGALPAPLSNHEAHALEKICRSLRWERPQSGRLLAGWLVLAPVCGALAWRPSVWITGGAGAGKSDIAQRILKPILGDFALFVALSTTEATLRRALRSDALPVVFDEADSPTPEDAARLQSIFGLMRQASAVTDSAIGRATADGGIVLYRPRSMFCFQSINTTLASQADLGRVEVLALRDHSLPSDMTYEALLDAIHKHIVPEFGPRLFARTLRHIPTLRANARTFAAAILTVGGTSSRRADQIGTLLAGAFLLHSTRQIALADAVDYVRQDASISEEMPPETRDEMQLLARILAHRVRYIVRDYSLGELVEVLKGDDATPLLPLAEVRALLRAAGIKPMEMAGQLGLAISTTHPALRAMLARTPWANSWGRSLSRVPGARASSAVPAQHYGPGLTSRAVWVPLSAL